VCHERCQQRQNEVRVAAPSGGDALAHSVRTQCERPCLTDLALPLRLEQINRGLEHGGGAPRRGGGSFGYARHVTRRQPPGRGSFGYARHVAWRQPPGRGSFGYAHHVTRRQPPGIGYTRHVTRRQPPGMGYSRHVIRRQPPGLVYTRHITKMQPPGVGYTRHVTRRQPPGIGYSRHVILRQPPGLVQTRHVTRRHSPQETRVHTCVNDVTTVDDVAPQRFRVCLLGLGLRGCRFKVYTV